LSSTSAQTSGRSPLASGGRLAYIDCARGIAVLLMIEAHTVDAWTQLGAARHSTAFRNATVLGGFAAPLFLWLAGLGVALAAARTAERHGRRAAVEAACRRGTEIFLLAFLFRLQALLLTPGGEVLSLFRVDILNIMGPAMIAAGVLSGVTRTTGERAMALSLATAAVAMATPIVRASGAVDLLPVWLQWYVRPAGDMTTFAMLPWAAFVFAGAVAGVVISASIGGGERRAHAALAAAGAALIAVGFWTAARPTIYAVSSFWTSSPTWFAIRLGIVTITLSALYAVDRLRARGSETVAGGIVSWLEMRLARTGRASLFIYWIHVELVYGYASWLWRHRLPLWGTAIACAAFCVVMYQAIAVRDWLVTRRRTGRRAEATATA
jgi:uncharacterized membrane protein